MAVWDLNTCLRHMDLLFGKKNDNVGTVNAGFAVGPVLGFKPSWGRLARDLSRCWRVCSEAPSYLPVGFSLKKKPHAGLDHRTGSVAMAPLWHTGVSSFKPRASCCNWSQIAFGLRLDCVYTCERVDVCLPSSKPTCVSVWSPKSVQNCWQVPIPLSGKSLHAYTVAWSPSCCARLASLKMWQVYSLQSATNTIYRASP